MHHGHLILGEEAREQFGLERVLFVPAGQPWRKTGRRISPAEDRLAMLRLAVEDNAALDVDDAELTRAGPSYTSDTLAALNDRYPGTELFFILGEDALADLPNWHDPGRILRLAALVVAARPGHALDPGERLPSDIADRVVRLSMPLIEISGSDIRGRIAAGRSVRYRVPSAVEEYIRKRGLYRD